MTKFEYKIEWLYASSDDGIEEQLDSLGEEGWEVVSLLSYEYELKGAGTYYSEHDYSYKFLLKRIAG